MVLLQQESWKTFLNSIITIVARILENLSEQYYYYYYRKNLGGLSEWYYYYYSKNPEKPLLQQESWKTFQNGIITITARIL